MLLTARDGKIPAGVGSSWVSDPIEVENLRFDRASHFRTSTCKDSSNKKSGTSDRTWSTPPTSFIKLNVDAAWKFSPYSSGFSAIIRDNQGSLKVVQISSIDAVYPPPLAEAFVVLQGLRLTSKMNFKKIIVKSDCSGAIDLFLKILISDSSVRVWLEEIWEISIVFYPINFAYIPRNINKLADIVAKRTRILGINDVWMDSYSM
ncbi:uncharacterized protein LOC120089172 [Benincasa hispida]|uniref:uncharacterized protein LOC120089172 n=1 Tax=Benincasa hispida TaxID=102211 RepID=UPI0018FFAD9C|nr:uncharacterized protein LOC120089172 [Benincasa hispida]